MTSKKAPEYRILRATKEPTGYIHKAHLECGHVVEVERQSGDVPKDFTDGVLACKECAKNS